MTKYIQGDDGKFAGSIGDGKSKVPTESPVTHMSYTGKCSDCGTVTLIGGPKGTCGPCQGSDADKTLSLYAKYMERPTLPSQREPNPSGYCARCESECDELSDEGYCGGCFDDIEAGIREPMTDEERNTVGVIAYNEPFDTSGKIRPIQHFPATPYADGHVRTVRFTTIPEEARIKCEFLETGTVVDSKFLTAAEAEGLEEFVSFSQEDYEVDAHHIESSLDHMIFDDEELFGAATNFELNFSDFIAGRRR
jgi:hypothetical protein